MHDAVLDMVKQRYASQQEVEKYRQRTSAGLLAWEKTVAEQYMATPGRLLDVGCGGGREAFALQAMGHTVTGIDISPEEIESARQAAKEMGQSIDFQLCNGLTLGFPDDSFDFVVIWAQVLGNVPGNDRRLALLKECARVLAGSGKLSFSVHTETCEPVARRKGMIKQVADVALEGGDFILRGDSESDTDCFWHYFRKDEILDLCRRAGLDILCCRLAQELDQRNWDTIWVSVCGKKPA